MNVLNISGSVSPNGADSTLRRLDRYFSDADLSMGIFGREDDEFDNLTGNYGIDTEYFGPSVTHRLKSFSLLPGPGYFRAPIHALSNRNEFDVIHVYGGPLLHGPAGGFYRTMTGAPLITRFNGYIPVPDSRPKKVLVKSIVRRLLKSDAVVFNSTAQKEDVLSTFAVPDDVHIRVIPPGVRQELFRPVDHDRAIRESLDIDEDTFLLGSCLTPRPVKRLGRAFDVLDQLSNSHDIEYVVVGDSDQLSTYISEAEDRGVGDIVHWIGHKPQSELSKWYSLFDVTILTSQWESFGMSITESSLCETPCVAFEVGGMIDQIENGQTGYLVDPYDTVAFARQVERLLEDEERLERFGLNARPYVKGQFTLERAGSEYDDMLESLVSY